MWQLQNPRYNKTFDLGGKKKSWAINWNQSSSTWECPSCRKLLTLEHFDWSPISSNYSAVRSVHPSEISYASITSSAYKFHCYLKHMQNTDTSIPYNWLNIYLIKAQSLQCKRPCYKGSLCIKKAKPCQWNTILDQSSWAVQHLQFSSNTLT